MGPEISHMSYIFLPKITENPPRIGCRIYFNKIYRKKKNHAKSGLRSYFRKHLEKTWLAYLFGLDIPTCQFVVAVIFLVDFFYQKMVGKNMGSRNGSAGTSPAKLPRMWGSHLPLSPQLLCVGATVNSCAKASRWPWAQVWGGRGFWHLKKVSGKGRKVSKATGWRKNTHREGFGMMIWWLFFGVRGTIVSWKENKHSQLFPAIFCDTFWGKPNNSFKTDDFALQVMIIHQMAVFFLNIILQNRWLDRSGGDDIYIFTYTYSS